MPLIWSQLVKCVLITAKVWMNMSHTKDRAFQPHKLTIKRDLPQLDVLHANPQRRDVLVVLPRTCQLSQN